MLRTPPLLATASLLVLLVCSTAAADAHPDKIALVVNASSFGFVPVQGVDYLIDQPSPTKDFNMQLKRDDHRMPFGDIIPGWRGTKEVVLKDGYHLRINARYLVGEPIADVTRDRMGLSLDVSFYYDQRLIGFQTATQWVEPTAALKVTAELKDVPYFEMLSSNKFELPAVTDGYGEGFRAWAAVRDGLKKRDKKECTYESLTECLKSLNRNDNLMIPAVTLTAKVRKVD